MSARVSGLGYKNPDAQAAFDTFIGTADPAALGPQTLILARAFALETLHDQQVAENINAALRTCVCARLGLLLTA